MSPLLAQYPQPDAQRASVRDIELSIPGGKCEDGEVGGIGRACAGGGGSKGLRGCGLKWKVGVGWYRNRRGSNEIFRGDIWCWWRECGLVISILDVFSFCLPNDLGTGKIGSSIAKKIY